MGPGGLWQRDLFLRDITIDDYDLVSLDVFDTMLLRTCAEPADVFDEVGARLEDSLTGFRLSPKAFRGLRREAEARARSRRPHGQDCTFDEILAELPFPPELMAAVRACEVEVERRVLFANPNLRSFAAACAERGKTIVFLSDMYHDEKQIRSFLIDAGLEPEWVTEVFVSSERGTTKATGELFEVMLAAHPGIDRHRVLHIGDNEKADVRGAELVGVRAVHYAALPQPFGSVYDVEKTVYRAELAELESLRKVAAVTHCHPPGSEEEAFHVFGATVLGPAYALFADWVTRYATERGIGVVLPMMREGELLTRVVARSIEAHGAAIECRPLYVSRQPAFIASIHEDNYEERVSQALLRGGRTVHAVLDELGVARATSSGVPDDRPVAALPAPEQRALHSLLCSDEVRSRVLRHAADQRGLFLRYLNDLTGGKPSLTVDIGTKGTTERYLGDLPGADGARPELAHALMMGSGASNVANILDGVDITAWLGIAGENDALISRIKYQIQVLETFVNAPVGTTLGYEDASGAVRPVLGEPETPQDQAGLVALAWHGVEVFQRAWLEVAKNDPGLRDRLLHRKADVLRLLLRFIDAPSLREAQVLGGLTFRDSFNGPGATTLRGTAEPESDDTEVVRRFIVEQLRAGSFWPQSAVALRWPGYSARILLEGLDGDPLLAGMLGVLGTIKAGGWTKGLVFGASELGRKFHRLADLMDVPLQGYVDSDKRLHGSTVGGLSVGPLDEAPEDVDYFVIASYQYAAEIRGLLDERCAGSPRQPRVFDFSASAA